MKNSEVNLYTGSVINFLSETLHNKWFYSLTEKLPTEKVRKKLNKIFFSIEKEAFSLQSPIETIMYYLIALVDGIIFSPQVEIGKYKVDFCITIPIYNSSESKKIIIECDGHEFHEKTKEQAQHDKERDRFLQAEGYPIYRFTGSEIYRNPLKVYFELCDIIYRIAGGEDE